MIFIHRIYTSVFTGEHGHAVTDTVRAPDPDPEALTLDELTEQPAALPSGIWRVSCTPECEAVILANLQFSGASLEAIPLTADEETAVKNEAARANVEVAAMSRAMYQLVTAGAAAGPTK